MKLKKIYLMGALALSSAVGMASAAVVSFGDIVDATPGGGLLIPDSGGIVGTGGDFIVGTGSPDVDHGDSGPPAVTPGGPYEGTTFEPSLAPLVADLDTITKISGGNIGGRPNNAVGFYVQFSSPIPMYELLVLDLDSSNNSTREWATAFAFNGTSFIDPILSFQDSGSGGLLGDLTTSAPGDLANMQTAVDAVFGDSTHVISELSIAGRVTGNGGLDPDVTGTQALFDFGGTNVDALFFAWGLESASSTPNSGVTGFSVNQSTVPEPSVVTLCGVGLLWLGRRKRG